jgi:hypothetical protein
MDDLSYPFCTLDLYGVPYGGGQPCSFLDGILCWDKRAIHRDPRMRESPARGFIGVFTIDEARSLHQQFTSERLRSYEPGSLAHRSQIEVEKFLSSDRIMYVLVDFSLDDQNLG